MNDALRNEYASDFKAIRCCVGKRVQSLSHAQYVFNDEPETLNLGDVELAFADGTRLLFTLEGDGESVRAEARPLQVPEPLDMGAGDRARWERVELTERPEYAFVRGAVLTGAEALIDVWTHRREEASEYLIGWEMQLGGGPSLVYFNAGDEGRLLVSASPPVYEEGERQRAPVLT